MAVTIYLISLVILYGACILNETLTAGMNLYTALHYIARVIVANFPLLLIVGLSLYFSGSGTTLTNVLTGICAGINFLFAILITYAAFPSLSNK